MRDSLDAQNNKPKGKKGGGLLNLLKNDDTSSKGVKMTFDENHFNKFLKED